MISWFTGWRSIHWATLSLEWARASQLFRKSLTSTFLNKIETWEVKTEEQKLDCNILKPRLEFQRMLLLHYDAVSTHFGNLRTINNSSSSFFNCSSTVFCLDHQFLRATFFLQLRLNLQWLEHNYNTVPPLTPNSEKKLYSHGHYLLILKLEVRSQPFITLNAKSKRVKRLSSACFPPQRGTTHSVLPPHLVSNLWFPRSVINSSMTPKYWSIPTFCAISH